MTRNKVKNLPYNDDNMTRNKVRNLPYNDDNMTRNKVKNLIYNDNNKTKPRIQKMSSASANIYFHEKNQYAKMQGRLLTDGAIYI